MRIFSIQSFSQKKYVNRMDKAQSVSFCGVQTLKLPQNFDGTIEKYTRDGSVKEFMYEQGKKIAATYLNPKGDFLHREYDLMGRLKGVIKQKINGYQKAVKYDENKNIVQKAVIHSKGFTYLADFYKSGTMKKKVSRYKDGLVATDFFDKNKVLRRKIEKYDETLICKYNYDKNGQLCKQIIEQHHQDGVITKTFFTASGHKYMAIEKSPDGKITTNFFYSNGNVKKAIEKLPDGKVTEHQYDKNENLLRQFDRHPTGRQSYIYYEGGRYTSMLDYSEDGRITTYFYDDKGKITNTIEISKYDIEFNDLTEGENVVDAFDVDKMTPNLDVAKTADLTNDRLLAFSESKMISAKKLIGDVKEFFSQNLN